MATKDHFGGYTKYFGNIFANLSPEGTTEEQIKEVYNEWASRFDEENFNARVICHKPQVECLDSAIKKYLNKPKEEIKIIDCGAGTGLSGVELNEIGYTNLCALDISQEMLNEAKKKNVFKIYLRPSK